ncbi:PP0621 family protein [Candidatus Thioglobus sp.]|nr:PP0621 family protein [Candidatus Thioglobus sp.]
MIKLILVLLLGWVGISLFKRFMNPNASKSVKTKTGQKMLACSVCDTHVPESDAIIKNGKIFCSQEHSE